MGNGVEKRIDNNRSSSLQVIEENRGWINSRNKVKGRMRRQNKKKHYYILLSITVYD